MKKLFAFVCVMMFLQHLVFVDDKEINLTIRQDDQKSLYPITRSITQNVSGYYDTETGVVSLYFYQSIGDATVSLTDETGAVVYSRIVDTENSDMLEFPLPEQSGTYMLSIISATYEGTGSIVL